MVQVGGGASFKSVEKNELTMHSLKQKPPQHCETIVKLLCLKTFTGPLEIISL